MAQVCFFFVIQITIFRRLKIRVRIIMCITVDIAHT